jgi:ribosomal protein L29
MDTGWLKNPNTHNAMSRSYHVTNKQLVRERIENAVAGCDGDDATELEEKDIKKDIAKVNTAWSRQAERDGLRPGLKMRLKDRKIEVI